MKAYIQADQRTKLPSSVNNFVAMEGFRQLGVETVLFYTDKELEDAQKEDIIVGGIGIIRKLIKARGISGREINYPDELKKFYGRKIWQLNTERFLKSAMNLPVFIKPVIGKLFTGFCCRVFGDLIGRIEPGENIEIFCSDVINIRAEWRVFVRYNKIVDIRHYSGALDVFYDMERVKAMIKAFKLVAPAGYALDIGVTDKGETLVVEVNDGYSLGAYGLDPLLYAKLLSARWSELMHVKDPFGDDIDQYWRLTKEEYWAKLDEYEEKFGEGFPAAGWGSGKVALIEEIDKCIKSGKPYKEGRPIY